MLRTKLNKIISVVMLLSVLFMPGIVLANQSLSPKTYERLNEIQELIQSEQFTEALQVVSELEADLTPGFGLALAYQMHAQLMLAQEDSQRALLYFNKALELEALKPSQAVSLATNVAQLYLSSSQPAKAIAVLQSRIVAAEKEKAGSTVSMAYITLGSALQVQKQYADSIPWLQEGVKRSDKPKENWLQMLMAAHYQIKQFAEAIAVLEQLIVINADKEEYWLQQASLYQLREKPAQALNTLEAAYIKGVLVKEDGLILMTQLLINQGIPERAARILDNLLKNQQVELSEENLRLMASAWLQGKERVQAIAGLIQAAEQSKKEIAELPDEADKNKRRNGTAKLYYRAAQLAFEVSDFETAALQYQNARQEGLSLNQHALSLLMQGNAYFELENYQMAKVYFSKAQQEPRTTAAAKSWLDYMSQLEVI
jgi:tetratricopeptide (TPR) repeat protein